MASSKVAIKRKWLPKRTSKVKREVALSKARMQLHEAIFTIYRMLFDLTNALQFSTSGDLDAPSDSKFYHLKRQAAGVLGSIEAAEMHLRPYLTKRLAEPDKTPKGSGSSD